MNEEVINPHVPPALHDIAVKSLGSDQAKIFEKWFCGVRVPTGHWPLNQEKTLGEEVSEKKA